MIKKWEDFYKSSSFTENKYFSLFFAKNRNRAIQYFLKDSITKATLLEIGCGNGEMLNVFKKSGFKTIGIDIHYEIINKCLINNTFVCGDIQKLPFKNSSFNNIYSFSVLQYCDHNSVLSECNRILSNLGKLVLTENMGKNPFSLFYRYIHNKMNWKYPPFQTPQKYIEWNDKIILKYFPDAYFVPFHLTTPLVMYAFRIFPHNKMLTFVLYSVYHLLNLIDRIILFVFPFFAKYCWRVMIVAKK